MRNINNRYLTAIVLASVATSFASAQAGGAVNAATTAASIPNVTAPSVAATSAAQSAAAMNAQQAAATSSRAASSSANLGAQSAANNAAQVSTLNNNPAITAAGTAGTAADSATRASLPAAATDVDAGMTNSAAAQADRSAENASVNASVDTSRSAGARTGSVMANDAGSNQIAASLNTAQVTRQLRTTSGEGHDAVLKQISTSVSRTNEALARLRHDTRDFRSEERARFNAAYDTMRDKEVALRNSLRDARHASADQLADARSKVASDYEAYAQAVAAVETTAHGSASSTTTVTP